MNWFVINAIGVLSILFLYLGYRITGIGIYSWYLSAVCSLLILLYPLVWYGTLTGTTDQIVRSIVHIDMGFISLMLAFLVMRDLIFLPLSIFKFDFTTFAFSKNVTLSMMIISFSLLAFGFWNAKRGPEIKQVEILFQSLPSELEGYKIVQVSDLHAGPAIDATYVNDVIRTIIELKADIVVMTGDIADGKFEIYKDRINSLKKLSTLSPVLYVTGNHEYIKDSGLWIEEFKKLGMRVLLNQHLLIRKGESSILFAGVIDPEIKEVHPNLGPDIHAALKNQPKSDLKILLAHQPSIAKSAFKYFDLQLSGHTHAGQFFPWSTLIKFVQPYSSGLKKIEQMWVYTNSGTGYWGPPFRLGTRSEITLIKLVKE